MSQNSNTIYLNFLKKSGVSTFLQNKPRIYYDIKTNKDDDLIKNNISEINNLNDLKLLIKKTNNLNLPINSFKPIIGEGNEKAKLIIIGEFPGEEENQKTKSIVGESEQLLNKMLQAINLKRDEIYTTNVIPWVINKNKKIENKDILECLPFIQKQIEIINPNIILLMGPTAAKAILNSNLDISKLRGKWHQYKSINLDKSIECLVTYHPKYLIQFPKEKKYAWEDLKMLQKKAQHEN